jgi:hypothetical protein
VKVCYVMASRKLLPRGMTRHNTKARSLSHCCSGKAISITYSECVSVVLVMQHAMHMRRIILLLVPGWLNHVFPRYLIRDTIFGKNVTEHKMCVLIFSANFV